MTSDPRRVLVVEDDPAIRRGVVAALAFAGYDVLEAGDGPRGLALAETAEGIARPMALPQPFTN